MRTHAQAVIVGGGIMGTSLLYHLAKEGWTGCVLVAPARHLPRLDWLDLFRPCSRAGGPSTWEGAE
jgi:2-polyprenyl-6-methoxyphenol hydroxylase-like FAD-dependent oxidoreductase